MQNDYAERNEDVEETPAIELQELIQVPARPFPVTTEDVLSAAPADTALFVP